MKLLKFTLLKKLAKVQNLLFYNMDTKVITNYVEPFMKKEYAIIIFWGNKDFDKKTIPLFITTMLEKSY